MKNFERREPGAQPEKEDVPGGDQAEDAIIEFIGDVFACVKYVKQTKKWGENDINGVDGVVALEDEDGNEYLLALEASGPDAERRRVKTAQQKREPLVYIKEERDDSGSVLIEATDKKIPRLRIGYNLSYVLALAHEAREKNLRMAENMNKNNRRKELVKLKQNIIESFFRQIDQLRNDSEFVREIRSLEEIFKEEMEVV